MCVSRFTQSHPCFSPGLFLVKLPRNLKPIEIQKALHVFIADLEFDTQGLLLIWLSFSIVSKCHPKNLV